MCVIKCRVQGAGHRAQGFRGVGWEVLLQWLHNSHGDGAKNDKSKTIDWPAVSGCFAEHQSPLQSITSTGVNAYDAQQIKTDCPLQINYFRILDALPGLQTQQ